MSSLGCKALCIVISFLVLWSICPSSSLVYIKYLTRGTTFGEIRTAELSFEKFSRLSTILVFFLFYHCLFYTVRFQYSPVLVIFLFSKRSDIFLIWPFYSFRYLSFPTSHDSHDIFCQIPFLYHDYILLLFVLFFFIFWKQLDVVHIH